MAGGDKYRQQRRRRVKKNSKIDPLYRHRAGRPLEVQEAAAKKKYLKRAHKAGYIPSRLHPDGITPRHTNAIARRSVQKNIYANRLKYHQLTYKEAIEEDLDAEVAREYRVHVRHQLKEAEDKIAAAIDDAYYSLKDAQETLYTYKRGAMYHRYIRDFIQTKGNEQSAQSKKEFNLNVEPILKENTAKTIQNDIKFNNDMRVRAIAFRNKVLRTFRESITLFPKHNVVTVPMLSPTMTEAKIVSWEKKVGDYVNLGDVLCHVKTDKASLGAIEAHESGYVAKILVNNAVNGDNGYGVTHYGRGRYGGLGGITNTGDGDMNDLNDANTKADLGYAAVGKPIMIIVPDVKNVQRFARMDFNKNLQPRDEDMGMRRNKLLRRGKYNNDNDNNNDGQERYDINDDQDIDLSNYNIPSLVPAQITNDSTVNDVIDKVVDEFSLDNDDGVKNNQNVAQKFAQFTKNKQKFDQKKQKIDKKQQNNKNSDQLNGPNTTQNAQSSTQTDYITSPTPPPLINTDTTTQTNPVDKNNQQNPLPNTSKIPKHSLNQDNVQYIKPRTYSGLVNTLKRTHLKNDAEITSSSHLKGDTLLKKFNQTIQNTIEPTISTMFNAQLDGIKDILKNKTKNIKKINKKNTNRPEILQNALFNLSKQYYRKMNQMKMDGGVLLSNGAIFGGISSLSGSVSGLFTPSPNIGDSINGVISDGIRQNDTIAKNRRNLARDDHFGSSNHAKMAMFVPKNDQVKQFNGDLDARKGGIDGFDDHMKEELDSIFETMKKLEQKYQDELNNNVVSSYFMDPVWFNPQPGQ